MSLKTGIMVKGINPPFLIDIQSGICGRVNVIASSGSGGHRPGLDVKWHTTNRDIELSGRRTKARFRSNGTPLTEI